MENWNESNAQKLNAAVKSLNLVDVLMSKLPKCKGATIDERAVTGSEQQGFLNCIEEIRKLCKPPKDSADSQESI